MVCPSFKQEYVGICLASRKPYIPSIAEMEQYCFTNFGRCSIFMLTPSAANEDVPKIQQFLKNGDG